MKRTITKGGFTLVEIMIVVVIIGLLAAMAVPAFNKVRDSSRSKTITNNLRQIASAGMQYIFEKGISSVGFAELNGVYFSTIQSVAQEDYTPIVLSSMGGTISVTADISQNTVVFTY